MTPSRTINNLSCSRPTSRNRRSSWVWTRLARPLVLSLLSTILIPPAQSQAVQVPFDTFKVVKGASQNPPAASRPEDVNVPHLAPVFRSRIHQPLRQARPCLSAFLERPTAETLMCNWA
jgi:hypothetical protein